MIDKALVTIKAGDGGDGSVHFRREKFVPKGGPDGGDGGRGGSVYFLVDAQVNTLKEFAYRQKFEAENGGRGREQKSFGKAGADMVIKVPVGTVVKWVAVNGEVKTLDLDKNGEKVLIARGGRGGRGNCRFKSSINTTPKEAELGSPGEKFEIRLELKLLADVGLIGLPSVGKSTLLSVITSARPKIAAYEFTTLEPNLGVMKKYDRELVLADIPGLIEGASEGRGLGDDFLAHVERTRTLVHVMAVNNLEYKDDELIDVLYKNYLIIRKELANYNRALLKKKEIVVLNKIDLISKDQIEAVIKFFTQKKIKVNPVSCGNLEGVDDLVGVIFNETFEGNK
jgi:GTPase